MKKQNIFYSLILIGYIITNTSCKPDEPKTPDNPLNGKTTAVFNPDKTYGTVTDIDWNVYKTIVIGTQTWMAENLRVTRYQNGDIIPNIADTAQWAHLESGAFCNYNNTEDLDTIATYGRLYNWYAAADSRNIAPKGWRVPTQNDWRTLTYFLGESLAGRLLKESGTLNWVSPNHAADNTTGFSALPGGFRFPYLTVNFSDIGSGCYLWSSTQSNATSAYFTYFDTGAWGTTNLSYNKQDGMSVRCVLVK